MTLVHMAVVVEVPSILNKMWAHLSIAYYLNFSNASRNLKVSNEICLNFFTPFCYISCSELVQKMNMGNKALEMYRKDLQLQKY